MVIGRPRTPGLAQAISEFEGRAARYWPIEVRELREASSRGGRPEQVRTAEWQRLTDAARGALVVVCDGRGRAMASREFAAWLEARRAEAADLAFVIGGAHGLPAEATEEAALVLSLAAWTLPHELARLVLAEQLYRAGTILRGEPYHK